MRTTKALTIMVTNQFTDKLLATLENAKLSPANLSQPLTKSEVLRQAALIGFEVIDKLGENYQGNAHAAKLVRELMDNATS